MQRRPPLTKKNYFHTHHQKKKNHLHKTRLHAHKSINLSIAALVTVKMHFPTIGATLLLLSSNDNFAQSWGVPKDAGGEVVLDRRKLLTTAVSATVVGLFTSGAPALADGEVLDNPVIVSVTGQVKQLYRDGQALEFQGNMAAAQRIYTKVTKIVPRVSE